MAQRPTPRSRTSRRFSKRGLVAAAALLVSGAAISAEAVVPLRTLLLPPDSGFLLATASSGSSTYLIAGGRLTQVDAGSWSVRWTLDLAHVCGLGCDRIAADETGVVVSGILRQDDGWHVDIVVTRLDVDGHEVWTRVLRSPLNDFSSSLAMVGGVVYLTGDSRYDPSTAEPPEYSTFLRRFAPDGEADWTILERPDPEGVYTPFTTVTADASGAYVVAADVSDVLPEIRRYDADGVLRWTLPMRGPALTFMAITGLSVSGTQLVAAGYLNGHLPRERERGPSDAFVISIDATAGEVDWTRQFGSAATDEVCGVSVDDAGVYVAGTTHGALPRFEYRGGYSDAFIRAYEADGDRAWTRQFGTRRYDDTVGVSSNGTSVTVAGNSDGSIRGSAPADGITVYVRQYPSL